MPKDVHHQQERVKLCKLGGKSKNKVEASPSQSNKLGGVGKMFVMSKSRKQMWERMKTAQVDQMKDYRIEGKTHRRSPAEGPKKMKEVSAKVVAVKKIEPKEGSVPGVGGGVDPGEPGRKILVEKWQNIERHFSEREIDSQANASLASGGKEGKIFVMSKSRKQMWDRMKKNVASAPRLVQSAHVDQMRDYRPKGKTHRKAHYDPKEVPDERAKQILGRRQRNDSKPGGLSKSRMFGKKHPELGSNRGFRRPYRERPDRPFNFDKDEEGPPM